MPKGHESVKAEPSIWTPKMEAVELSPESMYVPDQSSDDTRPETEQEKQEVAERVRKIAARNIEDNPCRQEKSLDPVIAEHVKEIEDGIKAEEENPCRQDKGNQCSEE